MQEHIERLNRHIEHGTLIRGSWRGTDEQGRETACLLAAMVPACGRERTATACPATIMPSWLAYLTPSIDDRGSIEAWPGMVKRFAGLAARWHTLDAAAWRRVQFTWLAAVVRDAASHSKEPAVTAICERLAVLYDGVVTTGEIDAAAFDDARASARAAAAAWAAAAASWAADAVLEAAAAASWAAASAAASAASAWASEAASEAAAAAAAAAAWDRLTVVLFDAIERELG